MTTLLLLSPTGPTRATLVTSDARFITARIGPEDAGTYHRFHRATGLPAGKSENPYRIEAGELERVKGA